jgi:hypothetical protein
LKERPLVDDPNKMVQSGTGRYQGMRKKLGRNQKGRLWESTRYCHSVIESERQEYA